MEAIRERGVGEMPVSLGEDQEPVGRRARRLDDGSAYLPAEEGAVAHPSGDGVLPGLSHLRWRQHKGSATALMLLFALAIKSNLDQKTNGRRTGNQVVATYEHLMALTNLSCGPVAAGLELLRELGAITTEKSGNGCVYTLLGIEPLVNIASSRKDIFSKARPSCGA